MRPGSRSAADRDPPGGRRPTSTIRGGRRIERPRGRPAATDESGGATDVVGLEQVVFPGLGRVEGQGTQDRLVITQVEEPGILVRMGCGGVPEPVSPVPHVEEAT